MVGTGVCACERDRLSFGIYEKKKEREIERANAASEGLHNKQEK